MSLRRILADIKESPRPPAKRRVVIELPTAMYHRLSPGLQEFLLTHHAGHRATWATQTFALWEADHREFLRQVEMAEKGTRQ